MLNALIRVSVMCACREQIKTPRQVSLFFYIADEAGSSLKISGGNGKFAAGTANEVGGWELHVKNQVQVGICPERL